MPDTRRRKILLLIVGATVLVTAVCFLFSDRPGTAYLNPLYVDVLVLCAGAFLLWDAFRSVEQPQFFAVCLRAAIGAAIITIHVFQFLFDLARR